MCAQQPQPDRPRFQQEITDALVALRQGAPHALEQLMPLVYGELRHMAHRQLQAERQVTSFVTGLSLPC